MLVDFFIERLGFAPRDVISAIKAPEASYQQIFAASRKLNYNTLKDTITGFGDEWIPDFELHVLFEIRPVGESDGITVQTKFQLAFKSHFIAQEVGASMARWAREEGLALYNQVRTMGKSARVLLGWLFEPLSMQQLSESGSDLYLMQRTNSKSYNFQTQDPPKKSTEQLPHFPMVRQSFNPIVRDKYVLSLAPNTPLFDAYLAQQVGDKVILWILQLTVQHTAHGGSANGYKKIKELKSDLERTPGTTVTVKYVLVKPNDGDAGQWTFPAGFRDLQGPVYCSFLDFNPSPSPPK